MTEQEIIEGNKLIAKFDGLSDYPDKGYLNAVKYHSSWDWLMPVVIQCRKTYLRSNATDTGLKLFYGNTELGEPINKVWIAVVEFIKWAKGMKQ